VADDEDELANAPVDPVGGADAPTDEVEADPVEEDAEAPGPEDPRLLEAKIALADAQAAKAREEVRKAKREEDEATDDLSRQKREAAAKQTVAEADKAAAAARQAEVTAFIPDFSKVVIPETKVPSDRPLFESVLAQRAITSAAEALGERVRPYLKLGAEEYALITSGEDFVSVDAAFIEVSSGMAQLLAGADALNPPQQAGFAAAPIIAAVAGALPGLMSLLVPRKTISSSQMELDSTAACAAVAGELAAHGLRVRLDDFRTVPSGKIVADEARLRSRRNALAKLKFESDAEHSLQEVHVSSEQARLTALEKQRDEATAKLPAPKDVDGQIETVRDRRDKALRLSRDASARSTQIDELVKSIDAFTLAIHIVSAGGTRSPFVAAALHEELREVPSKSAKCTRVVFIKSTSGTTEQFYRGRGPLSDKVDSIGSVSLSYWVMDAATSDILVAGIAGGSARLHGVIGNELRIDFLEKG